MRKISASGIKSADFQIWIAEKTHDPPYRLSEKWMTPPLYAFIKNRWPPPHILPPPPSAEVYEQSLKA